MNFKEITSAISVTKIVLVLIVCSLIVFNYLQIEVTEPLNNIALMVVAFYFGQKVNLGTKTYKEEDASFDIQK